MLREAANQIAVRLYKHVPWMGERWARRHRFVESAAVPWTPLGRPIRESVVALVTTAGVHLRSDRPFDMDDPDGDPTFRVIPSDARREHLTITHRYYDHSAADRDINVVLPLDRLREIHAEGGVAGIAPRIYGFMGHIDGPHLTTLIDRTAPEVARHLLADGAEAAVLTPA